MFELSEKHTKFEKKSSSWFGHLLSKCTKNEEDCATFCVLLRKSELQFHPFRFRVKIHSFIQSIYDSKGPVLGAKRY